MSSRDDWEPTSIRHKDYCRALVRELSLIVVNSSRRKEANEVAGASTYALTCFRLMEIGSTVDEEEEVVTP